MAIEAGARAGLVAPDEKTYAYLQGREFAPAGKNWDLALAYWKSLPSDDGAVFDAIITLDAADIAPQVSWGTSPEQVVGVNGLVPSPESFDSESKRKACESALAYMGLTPNTKITDIPVYWFVHKWAHRRFPDCCGSSKRYQSSSGCDSHCCAWFLSC
jgi:3-isopropylmalate/(R)-2-methylmalate dehydratase large subunit